MNPVHVAVRWPGMANVQSALFQCELGKDIKISPELLQDYCAKLITPVEQDLVVLAASVAFADRLVRRQHSMGWSRDLVLTVPVSDPSFWSRSTLTTTLHDALEYVTGDHWEFDFVKDCGQSLVKGQSSLDFTSENYVVLPFSDGLDSFLQWQLLKQEDTKCKILRVHTKSRASNKVRNKLIDAQGDNSDQRLGMPVSFTLGDHLEPTYRTRTFLFFVIAALAASKSGTNRVVVGENGVGALGPSMLPMGDECPHRTTHPAFTRRLASFINMTLGCNIAFEHPQIYRTKGQVLANAISLGVCGWESTHSCTRRPQNRLDKKPCGVCGGCLLRRTAIHSAGKNDPAVYFWDNLSGITLDDCRSEKTGRNATKTDLDIAKHGIFDMSEFSGLGETGVSDEVFQRAAWELTEKAGILLDEAQSRIRVLAETHAKEWTDFRKQYHSSGFINA